MFNLARGPDAAVEVKSGPGTAETGIKVVASGEDRPIKPENKEEGDSESLNKSKLYHEVRKPNLQSLQKTSY